MRWKFWKKEKDEELKPFPILFEQTQEIIRKIKQDHPGEFLSYWISDRFSLQHDDCWVIQRILPSETINPQLNFFVRNYGGSGEAALRLVHLLREDYKSITAWIPLECASAGTMLALGADKIQMGALGYLGAVDTSFSHPLSPKNANGQSIMISQNELDRVIDLWEQKRNTSDKNPYENLYEHVHPLVFGAVDRIRSLSIRLTKEILNYHMKDERKASIISDYLNSGYPSHEYPITYNEAKRIGLPVEKLASKLEKHLIDLNNLYAEMVHPVSKYTYSERHERWIGTVIERSGEQFYYLRDTKFEFQHYTKRWQLKSDESGWRRVVFDEEGEMVTTRIYVN